MRLLGYELTVDNEKGAMANRLIWLSTILMAGLIAVTQVQADNTTLENAEVTSDTEQRQNAEIAEELTNPIADFWSSRFRSTMIRTSGLRTTAGGCK